MKCSRVLLLSFFECLYDPVRGLLVIFPDRLSVTKHSDQGIVIPKALCVLFE